MTPSNTAAAVFHAWNAPDGSSLTSIEREKALLHSLSGFPPRLVSFSNMTVALPLLLGAFSRSSAALDEMSVAFSMASATDGAKKEADGWQKVTDGWQKVTDRWWKWTDMAKKGNNEPKEVADASPEAAEVCNAETIGWQKEIVSPDKVAAPLKKVLAETQAAGKVVKSNPR